MTKDFIIKPNGLFPSTYSQMGRVLIPSKNCDNRKIARKYTEKGAKFVLDTQTGSKDISTPYISTFKRFDRPTPMISQDCQNCAMVSVPSVTDKTIYPCSLGKYSVTENGGVENKIGVMGNSMYPRITTSDYQLYQQYRVTEKNNIVGGCPCPLKTGIYSADPSGVKVPIIYDDKNCTICSSGLDVLFQGFKNLTKINDCEFLFEFDGGEAIITIDSNIQLTLTVIGSGEATVGTLVPPEPISGLDPYENDTPFTFISEQKCDDIIVADLDVKPTSISFKVNGQLQTFTEYVKDEDKAIIYLIKDSVIYTIEVIIDKLKGDSYKIISINDCDCLWVLCCQFKLESGVYTSTDVTTVPALVVSYENCELCLSNPGLIPTNAESINPISPVVETADPCNFTVGPAVLPPVLPVPFNIDSETQFTYNSNIYTKAALSDIPNGLNFNVLVPGPVQFNSTTSSPCSDISVNVESVDDGSSTKVSIFVDGELVITSTNAVELTTLTFSPSVYIIQNGETFYVFGDDLVDYVLIYIAQCNCFYINSEVPP